MGYNIQKYIVFYIDTTGLDIYHDYMNEILAIKYEDGKIINVFHHRFSYGFRERVLKEFITWSNNYDLVTHNYYGFSKYFIEQVDFLPNKIIDTLLLSKGKYKGMKSYDMDYILKKYDINTVKGDSIKNIVNKIQQLFLILTSKSN